MSDPFVLTFNWTVEDVLLAAKERDISITEEQASQLLEENAEHLAQIEGAAVSAALSDIIGENEVIDPNDIEPTEPTRWVVPKAGQSKRGDETNVG